MYNLIILLASHPITVYKNSNLKTPLSSLGVRMFMIGLSSITSEHVAERFLAKSYNTLTPYSALSGMPLKPCKILPSDLE